MIRSNNRLNKESWLALALEVLSQEGRAKIQIEYLAKKLGVTKGSFYAHILLKSLALLKEAFMHTFQGPENLMPVLPLTGLIL